MKMKKTEEDKRGMKKGMLKEVKKKDF